MPGSPSGATGRQASASSASRSQVARASPATGWTAAGRSGGGRRGSWASETCTPGSRVRSKASRSRIMAPSRASEAGRSRPRQPPPVTHSSTKTRMPPTFAPVPVIDLMGGQVVHARAGRRDDYRPLSGSAIADGPDPATVVEGLLALHPFRCLYIADLDAILKRGQHREMIQGLAVRFPGLELWVDAGAADEAEVAAWLALPAVRPVLGSESQADDRLLAELEGEPRLLLSLDLRGAERLDPAGLFEQPELWPDDVIVMTLARVGAGQGPDLEALGAVMARAGGRRVWAAGGVRDAADLMALRDLGCAGVLLATALHDGRLGWAELQAVATDGV